MAYCSGQTCAIKASTQNTVTSAPGLIAHQPSPDPTQGNSYITTNMQNDLLLSNIVGSLTNTFIGIILATALIYNQRVSLSTRKWLM